MKKLLKNVKLLDFKNNRLKDAHILIEDGKIVEIYGKQEVSDIKIDEIIDLQDNILIPSFVNSQSNLLMNFYDSYTNFDDYLTFRDSYNLFLKRISDEEKVEIYKYQLYLGIKNGITTFCDEDMFNLPLKKAVKETKVNFVYKIGIKNSLDDFDDSILSKLKLQNENYLLSLNSVLYNSEDNFSKMIKLSKQENKGLFCNASFNLLSSGNVEFEFNKSTVQTLEDYGLFDCDSVLFGANVLDKEDYQILNNYDVKLLFSPSLNLNFSFPPANIYSLSLTNRVGLASFKNDYSIEFYLTQNLQKNDYDKLTIFSDEQLLNFATIDNAKILGLNDVGKIEKGYRANFILIKNENLSLNANYYIKNFSNDKIKSVFINGNMIYNNNHFTDNLEFEHLQKQVYKIIKKYK